MTEPEQAGEPEGADEQELSLSSPASPTADNASEELEGANEKELSAHSSPSPTQTLGPAVIARAVSAAGTFDSAKMARAISAAGTFDSAKMARAISAAGTFDSAKMARAISAAGTLDSAKMARAISAAGTFDSAKMARAISAAGTFDSAKMARAMSAAVSLDPTLLARAASTPKFNPTLLARTATVAKFDPAVLVRTAMLPKFDPASRVSQLSRSLAAELVGSRRASRRPGFVTSQILDEFIGAASGQSGQTFSVEETVATAGAGSASLIVPTEDDGLLVDDAHDVGGWVAEVMHRVLDASGLSERDLVEDGVAGCVYAMTFCIVLAILVQFPLMATISGLTGAFPAHGSAVYMSRLSRRSFRSLEDL